MSTIRKINDIKDKDGPKLYLVDEKLSKGERYRVKNRKMPKYLKVMLAILFTYVVISFVIGFYQVWLLNQKIDVLEEEYAQLSKEQVILQNEIKSLNNPEVIEKMARENLGMVKPGEVIVVQAVPEKNIPKPQIVDNNDITD